MKVKAKQEQKTKKLVEVKTFLSYGNIFFLIIGMLAYDTAPMSKNYLLEILRVSYFWFGNVNLIFIGFSELCYAFLSFKKGINFIAAMMNLTYSGFVVIGILKIFLITRAHAKISHVVHALEDLHPKSLELQERYNVHRYLRSYRRISIFYSIIHMMLIWGFNLYWIVYYIIYILVAKSREFERSVPYLAWLPWDWQKKRWSYYTIYAAEVLSAQTCASGQISSDMFMCAFITLMVMHYQFLAKQIEMYKAGFAGAVADMDFLKDCIRYHQKILVLCDLVNDIFGIALLCNFLSSSFLICILAFQVTVGNPENLFMQFVFLLCSFVQIYMITNYAQKMADASESVGDAVYNHDWSNADLSYRKMLIMIIQRTHKPSKLKATSFLDVTLTTMTDLLQLSYKFFALLRTMYVK